MFHELTPDQFAGVRPLFAGFDYSLSLQAAIEGINPGRIFVDDVESSRAGLALTVEGYLLAGEHDDPEILEALRPIPPRRYIHRQGVRERRRLAVVGRPSEAWEARLPELIPAYEALKLPRYHYLCRRVALDWRSSLPNGYTLRRIDRELLANPDLALSEDLGEEEIEAYWGERGSLFRARDRLFGVLHGGEEVSHCTRDCATDTQVDVGVYTAPAHRRKGLAAAVVAATVEHCLSHGARQVAGTAMWRTLARGKTAERVGFHRNANTCTTITRTTWSSSGWSWAGIVSRMANYAGAATTMSRRSRRATITRKSIITARRWRGRTWGGGPGACHAERGRRPRLPPRRVARQQPAFSLLHGRPEWERRPGPDGASRRAFRQADAWLARTVLLRQSEAR